MDSDRRPEDVTVALVSDPRAIQFWDPDQLLSKAILKSGESDPGLLEAQRPNVIWDVIAVFAPRSRWDANFPRPEYEGHPVTRAIGGAKEAMTRLGN